MSDPTKQSKKRVYTEEQKKRKRELRLSKPLTDEQKQAKKIINRRYYKKTKHLKKYTHAKMSDDQINKHRLRNIHANMTEKQIEMHRKRNIHENMSEREIYNHRLRVRDPKSFAKRGNQCKIPTNFGN
jgi:lipase chaperone LimK